MKIEKVPNNNFPIYLLIILCFSSLNVRTQILKDPAVKSQNNIRLENLSLLKEKIIKYHNSGEYENELQKICNNAWEKIKFLNSSGSAAVVFDVDETTLSNYSHIASTDFGYIPFLWDKWVDSAKATAIKPVKVLYDSVVVKGFKVIFISGRPDCQYTVTLKNLNEQGFTKFDTLITRTSLDFKVTTAKFKENKRIELSKKGYNIVACIGDQYSDMYGKDTGIKVKLINYMYLIK